MLDLLSIGGSVMWLLILLAIFNGIVAVKAIISLYLKKHADAQVENDINAIVFWGAISAAIGVFGHFAGIYMAMQELVKEQDVTPIIVADGYLMSFSDIIVGLLILLFSSLLWLFLRGRFKRLVLD